VPAAKREIAQRFSVSAHTPRAVESDCSLHVLIGVFFIGSLLLLGLIAVFCLLLD
jgi:hypothetical protein